MLCEVITARNGRDLMELVNGSLGAVVNMISGLWAVNMFDILQYL